MALLAIFGSFFLVPTVNFLVPTVNFLVPTVNLQ